MITLVGADGDEVATLAADVMTERIEQALDERGRATLAVSGGSTPEPALRELGSRDLTWADIDVVQVDERVAPDGHPDRNLVMQAAAMPRARLHPMPVTSTDLADASGRYRQLLVGLAGEPPRLDLVQLGLGADGHTASWPPGHEVADGGVAVVPELGGRARLTLTPSVVNRAQAILWIVTGSAKRDVLARLLAGNSTMPAGRVRRHDVVVVCDRAAAGNPPPAH